jgi:hypothetical protein
VKNHLFYINKNGKKNTKKQKKKKKDNLKSEIKLAQLFPFERPSRTDRFI